MCTDGKRRAGRRPAGSTTRVRRRTSGPCESESPPAPTRTLCAPTRRIAISHPAAAAEWKLLAARQPSPFLKLLDVKRTQPNEKFSQDNQIRLVGRKYEYVRCPRVTPNRLEASAHCQPQRAAERPTCKVELFPAGTTFRWRRCV